MRRRDRTLAVRSVGVAAALNLGILSTAPIALAQPSVPAADPVESREIETILVIGTKQGRSLQETDVSVEIFNPERLDAEALFDLQDVLQRTPNIVTGAGNDNITIRGISRRGTAGQGETSNIYLDGAPLAIGFSSDTIWDIDQIEILRGPQSTVQGRNALAGAIILRTADPTFDFEGKARVRAAEFGTRQYAGVVSGPIIPGQLAARFAADYQETDGFIDSGVGVSDPTAFDNLMLRGKLLFEPESLSALRAEVAVDFNDLERGGANSVVSPTSALDPAFADFDPEELVTFGPPSVIDLTTFRILSDISYDLTPELTLRAIATYEELESDFILGDPQDPGRFPGNDFGSFIDTTTYSAELRLEYSLERWSGYLGAYYFQDESNRIDNSFNFVPDAIGFPIPITPENSVLSANGILDSERENYALYFSTRYEPNEKWAFDFAIRYDNEEFSTTGEGLTSLSIAPDSCVATVPVAALPPGVSPPTDEPFITAPCSVLLSLAPVTPPTPQDTSFDAVLPRGTLTYNATENLSFFGSVQRGYRAGGTFSTTDGFQFNIGSYEPEYLTNYEVGFRSQWLERQLTLNGNFFYSVLDDQQINLTGASGLGDDFITVNAGESTYYGAELSVDFIVSEEISLYGSLGLLDAEFDDFPYGPPGSEFENLAGNELPNAPPVSFIIGGSYKHPTGFFTDASLNYVGERQSFRNIENLGPAELGPDLDEEVDPQSILNARIGYATERFTLFAFGTNLFDDTDPTSRDYGNVNATTGQITFFPQAAFEFAAPRTLGVGLDLVF
ncbi:MAG: TonB-dependent receptor [Pseudomonadota bacterium]